MNENTTPPNNPMFLKSTMKLRDEFLNELRQYKITQSNGRELLYIFEEFVRRGREWERLYLENNDLRLQLQAAHDQLAYAPSWELGVDQACPECDKTIIEINDGNKVVARFTLDGEALEPTPPDGQMHYFFNTFSGPYRALDTRQEREYSWSRGPFGSWNEADQGWKAYIRQQDKDGKL